MTNIFNKRAAFEKLVKTKEFLRWHKTEVARRLGHQLADEAELNRRVDEAMQAKNLKVEEFHGT